MKVYILTSEPYHDNSTILGVYLDESAGVAALLAAPNPADINCDDFRLTEWDEAGQLRGRGWVMRGKQVGEVGPVPSGDKPEWRPVRVDFTFHGPEVFRDA